MTCRDATELIADYVEGHLPFRRRLSLGLHLVLCRYCRNYLDSYRKTIQASRSAFADRSPSDELSEDLIQDILRARKKNSHVD